MPTTKNEEYPERVKKGLIAVRGTRLYVELSGGSKDAEQMKDEIRSQICYT